MRERLIAYVDLLFAGNPEAEDIKQEILQNTLDKYDDLVAGGKSPEAAYSQAISGIGDISELLKSGRPAETGKTEKWPPAEEKKQNKWPKIILYSVLVILVIGLLVAALSIHIHSRWRDLMHAVEGDQEISFFFDDEDDFLTPVSGEPVLIGAEDVSEILVEWISGDVHVAAGDVEKIRLQENGSGEPLQYVVKNGELEVRFSKKIKGISWSASDNLPSKDLTITVPKGWSGRELEVHSVSADVEVRDLQLAEVTYQGVSGKCRIENARVDEMTVQTVSGDVTVNGEIWELECEGVSADCDLTVTNVPREITMEGVSGDLRLTLPADAGFTVEMDGLNKDLDTDFPVTCKNGKYIAGNGGCEIEIEGVSGKAKIMKAE